MPFGAAVAAMFGAAGIDQFTERNVQSEQVRRMMRRVAGRGDSGLEENFPEEWPARAVIDLTDGRRFEKFIAHPKGDPKNPLSWDELIAKFKALTGPVVTPDRSDEIVALVRNGDSWHRIPGLVS